MAVFGGQLCTQMNKISCVNELFIKNLRILLIVPCKIIIYNRRNISFKNQIIQAQLVLITACMSFKKLCAAIKLTSSMLELQGYAASLPKWTCPTFCPISNYYFLNFSCNWKRSLIKKISKYIKNKTMIDRYNHLQPISINCTPFAFK